MGSSLQLVRAICLLHHSSRDTSTSWHVFTLNEKLKKVHAHSPFEHSIKNSLVEKKGRILIIGKVLCKCKTVFNNLRTAKLGFGMNH